MGSGDRAVAVVTLAEQVVTTLRAKGWMMATAESCTGGLVAAAMTDIAGSSDVFDRGFVTYSNAAKTEMLGLDPALILAHGAVSENVARHMAMGALSNSTATVVVAVTGIAGPGGGSIDKPVGLVHFACAVRGGRIFHIARRFTETDRSAIRQAAVRQALQLVLEAAR